MPKIEKNLFISSILFAGWHILCGRGCRDQSICVDPKKQTWAAKSFRGDRRGLDCSCAQTVEISVDCILTEWLILIIIMRMPHWVDCTEIKGPKEAHSWAAYSLTTYYPNENICFFSLHYTYKHTITHSYKFIHTKCPWEFSIIY